MYLGSRWSPPQKGLPRRVFTIVFSSVGLAGIACLTGSLFGISAMAQSTATTTTLAVAANGSSVTSVTAGSVITLTASVSAGATPLTQGQVNFCDAAAAHCTDIHVLGTAQLTSAGSATIKLRPAIGTHTYKAVFLGTTSAGASTSGTSSLAVTGTLSPIATATTFTRSGSWGNYALTATVTETGGTAGLSGTISFEDTSNANATLGAASLGLSQLGWSWINAQSISDSWGVGPIAVADFNGDGIPDLAVSNGYGGTVLTYLGNGDGTFQPGYANSAPGSAPWLMVVADFNGDGIPDLAIPNTGNATLTILLGQGDGTFTPTSSGGTRLSIDPYSLVAGDFNGDGIPDLIATDISDQSAIVLLGNGDGTFASTPLPINGASSNDTVGSIAVGDFNGDGKPDLAIVRNGGVVILLGNGDGTFTQLATAPQAGPSAGPLTIGDFNGDGKLDLAVVNYTSASPTYTPNTVTILLGNGDGTFTASGTTLPATSMPRAIAVADFNGDGIPDLVIDGALAFIGKGDGTFGAGISTGVSSDANVAISDFDGDGKADLVGVSRFSGTVPVYLTRATQTASTPATDVSISGAGEHSVVASYSGDSNYNGSTSSMEMVWGQPPATSTTLAITAGGSSATSVTAGTVVTLTAAVTVGGLPLTSGQVKFCDATASSCTDIHQFGTAQITSSGMATYKYVPGPGSYSIRAVLAENGTAAGSMSAASQLAVVPAAAPAKPTTSTIAQSGTEGNYTLTATVAATGSDATITGNVSFLDSSYSNNMLASAALGASTPGLAFLPASSAPFSSGGFVYLAEGDFNGDGIPDIAAVNANLQTLTILLGKGDGTFAASTGATLPGYASAIVAGDFNGDGKTDLAISWSGTAYNSPAGMTVILGNGDGTFAAVSGSPTLGTSPKVFAAADFNGDGKLDLLVNEYSGTYGSTRILLGNGDGTFSQGPATGLGTTLAVADFNGDRLNDVVAEASWNTFAVYLGNGDGTFSASGSAMSANGVGLGAGVAGDFNGDGIPDFAVIGSNYSSVSVFLGKRDGTLTAAAAGDTPSVNEPGSMAVADFNHDGKLDLVITNWNAYSGDSLNPDLTVLYGNGDGTFTAIPGDTQLNGTWSVAIADFNGDGRPDLAVGSGATLNVLLTQPMQTATATVTGISPTGPGPHQVVASYPGDSNYSSSMSSATSLRVAAATPVFSPAAGTYTSTQTVTITCSTPGVTIYYQANGTVHTNGYVAYTGPISLSAEGETSISAYAAGTGYDSSQSVVASYTLNLPPAPAPVISPASGTYGTAQSVSITDSASGVPIYYTTNGRPPDTTSNLYSGPITVATSETITAMADGGGYSQSTNANASYLISSSPSALIYTVAGTRRAGYAGDGGPATAASLNFPQGTAIDNAGNLYIADSVNAVVRKVDAATGTISTVAGTGVPGCSGDGGDATKAQLSYPTGLAFDALGNLYIADNYCGQVRKLSVAAGSISTYAGASGATLLGDGGPATNAYLDQPNALAFDHAGNLYIGTISQVRMVSADTGIINTFAGGGGYSGKLADNGPATQAVLGYAAGLAFDGTGNLYIADAYNGVVRKVTPAGIISTLAGSYTGFNYSFGGDGGPATSAELSYPFGVAVDSAGNVYIADSGNNAVREVTASNGTINTVVGTPTSCVSLTGDGGPAATASACNPYGVTFDAAGNLYIAGGDSRVRKVTPSALPPATAAATPAFGVTPGTYSTAQTVTVSSSTPGAEIYITLDGTTPTANSAGYFGPIKVTGPVTIQALAVAPGYLPSAVSSASYTITAAPPSTITTVAGNGTFGNSGAGGPATNAALGGLNGVAVDGAGNLYIPDNYNSVIWKVTAQTGNISIFAGTLRTFGDTGNGGLATSATLGNPTYVAVDGSGNVYISDSSYGEIRKVAAATGNISLYAGSGYYNSALGDGGPATSAFLNNPLGIALDGSGNLYIADESNGRVRKVTPAGIITTVAGIGNFLDGGDGGLATSTAIAFPYEVAVDHQGNLYITEPWEGRVRKVDATSGLISTIAGYGRQGTTGDGGLATKAEVYAYGVAVDGSGNVYLTSTDGTVRMIAIGTGIISTMAGTGYNGDGADGVAATISDLGWPTGLALDSASNLYIVDAGNYRVRKMALPSVVAEPTFNPPGGAYTSAQSVTITDATAGASIYYTTDGSVPTASSSLYAGPISVSTTETLSAVAKKAGSGDSAVASAAYTITLPAATAPGFSPAAGTYTRTQSVSISDATSGATIYYTTDGSTPTTGSATYSSPITVASSETIKAIATASGYSTSPVASAAYVIQAPTAAAPPSFSPAAGTYTGTQSVTITDTTSGVTIYYTTDGSAPTTGSATYSSPITVASSETIKAIATASGYSTSPVASAAYVINPVNPGPTISSLSPGFTTAGGGGFSLTVNGSGFIAASTVYWGPTALTTTYVSATQLTGQVAASQIANSGEVAVTVQTPAPGGGTSNQMKFEVDTAGGSSPPTFTTTTVTVAPGAPANYSVNLPATATGVTVSCLNLPAGASCSYSASTGAVTISTSSSTPAGTYQITVVFNETLPGSATGFVLMPLLLLPLIAMRKRWTTRYAWSIVVLCLVLAAGISACGGGGNGGGTTTPPSNPTHQATSSGTVTLIVQ